MKRLEWKKIALFLEKRARPLAFGFGASIAIGIAISLTDDKQIVFHSDIQLMCVIALSLYLFLLGIVGLLTGYVTFNRSGYISLRRKERDDSLKKSSTSLTSIFDVLSCSAGFSIGLVYFIGWFTRGIG